MISWSSWPEVPLESRPKNLYVASSIEDLARNALEGLGWNIIDMRLMETDTDAKRAAAIMAWLEGVRLGSIDVSTSAAKYVELEMRACGLHSGSGRDVEPIAELAAEDVEMLLSFGKPRAQGEKDG